MSKKGQIATQDVDHSEVPFPAGSFDHESLQKDLDKAAHAPPEERQQLVEDAIQRGNQTEIGVMEIAPDNGVESGEVEPVVEPLSTLPLAGVTEPKD